jgi:hypothetical protein
MSTGDVGFVPSCALRAYPRQAMHDKGRRSRRAADLVLGGGVVVTLATIMFVVVAWAGPIPWPTVLGLIGMFVGLFLMVRIRRSDPEPDPRDWRYRELPVPVRVSSWSVGRRGRAIARSMIVVAGALIPLMLFYLVAGPGSMGGPMFEPRYFGLTLHAATLVLGFGGMAAGLGWMIRIYRADPEPDEPTWRYRS